MNNETSVQQYAGSSGSLQEYSVKDVVSQVAKIQTIMKEVMHTGEHFGVIPGCQKPSLLKPGAEKLGFTFRLAPRFSGETDPKDLGYGHREYIIKCELYHIQTGMFYGSGVGSCSTMEGKYRYRTGPKESTGKSVPKDYWDIRKSNPTKAQDILGGKGFMTMKDESGQWVICRQGEKVEHDNPADYYNTVLKMAKKRAHVDAILTATAASDIFTQDIEELVENGVIQADTVKEKALQPKQTDNIPFDMGQDEFPPNVATDEDIGGIPYSEQKAAYIPPESTPETERFITDKQRKRLYAIARSSGCSDDMFKDELLRMGIDSSANVPSSQYEDICSHFESMKK